MPTEKFKKVDVLLNNKSIIDITDENGYQDNILELGTYKIGDTLELEYELLENTIRPKEIMIYTLDLEKFKNITESLKQQELTIKEYKKDYIKATINVEENNKILYTSIPCDKGFKILVDNKETKNKKIFDTLIGLELEKGNHTIELKYTPRGLKEGSILSILGITIFILGEINAKKNRRNHN